MKCILVTNFAASNMMIGRFPLNDFSLRKVKINVVGLHQTKKLMPLNINDVGPNLNFEGFVNAWRYLPGWRTSEANGRLNTKRHKTFSKPEELPNRK